MTEQTPATPAAADELLRVAETVHAGEVSVAFRNGPTVLAKLGAKLLDIAEASQVQIESGCRMGMCGSDPVRILEGEENLSAMRSAERRTLERLGLGPGCRMACVSRVQGPLVVDPRPADGPSEPENGEPQRLAVAADHSLQQTIRRVVVVGAGVAGVTAAEGLRRALPDAELTLIGDEPYAFYNRMAITRLVSESVSIDSLYLNRRDWAESRRIDYRRGVPVAAIDRGGREVSLADGDRLPYDRVVLATGARPFVPPIEGLGAEGCFVLRTIDDAVQIQQYIRRCRCRTAVIVGAGLLGLEAAYYLAQLEVRVLVLDRGPWPLSRQLDEQAGALLWEMLQDLGIELLPLTEARRVIADERVTGVELIDGGSIDADLCLVATGVVPNSEVAEAAGLDVAVGVTVDDGMHTSDPHIFAVGDVVDHQGRRYGLWPASVEQAEVAATRMAGGEAAFRLAAQPARLKVPGIDLLSIGVVDARPGESKVVALSAYGTRRYRKLVVEDDRLTGAIILGSPELFDDVTTAVERRVDLGSDLDALERGKWQALSRLVEGGHSRARTFSQTEEGRLMAVDVEKLEESFDLVAPQGDELMKRFYDRLFEVAPSVQPLFADVDMEGQRQALLNMLLVLRESLRDLDDIVPDLEDLGVRHVEYGARPEHYPVVGQVLIETMAETAGDAWKPEYTAASEEAYGVIENVMISAASTKVE